MTRAADPELRFTVQGGNEVIELEHFRTVVAGYTGRDEQSVRAHIEELEHMGIAPPDSVPSFFNIDSELVTQAADVLVSGAMTSGEVEPLLVRSSGRLFLGVGSDHTDREVERISIAESKSACPKPVGVNLIELPGSPGTFDWDHVAVSCIADGSLYQDGTLNALRLPTDVLASYLQANGDDGGDLVMFGGTVPLILGEFVYGREWTISLSLAGGETISHSYRVRTQPAK